MKHYQIWQLIVFKQGTISQFSLSAHIATGESGRISGALITVINVIPRIGLVLIQNKYQRIYINELSYESSKRIIALTIS